MNTTPLAQVKPGQTITHQVVRGELIELAAPLLVISGLELIDPVSQVEGVRVFNHSEVDYVLYPQVVEAVVVASSQRGFATRNTATSAARKAKGWKTSGGHYYRPTHVVSGVQGYAYSGFQGIDIAGARFTRWGWIVQAPNGRWYVTPLATRKEA